MRTISELLDVIERDMKTAPILRQFEIGIALKIIEDRLTKTGNYLMTQRCNDLQHEILGGK